MKFLSTEQVVEIHETLLEYWGGEEGGDHRGESYEGVEAAIQAVKNSYYEHIEHLAAAYAVYIVQGHVFMDGNKRTGAAAMIVFLMYNGVTPTISMSDVVNAMIEMQNKAESGERSENLIQWIATLLID